MTISKWPKRKRILTSHNTIQSLSGDSVCPKCTREPSTEKLHGLSLVEVGAAGGQATGALG